MAAGYGYDNPLPLLVEETFQSRVDLIQVARGCLP